MTEHDMPELDPNLASRIRLVRRDMGDLLFHFTRASEQEKIMDFSVRQYDYRR